ncbi:MAG: hypothetical protein QM767_27650 [Anaeromyxobacter sp.]
MGSPSPTSTTRAPRGGSSRKRAGSSSPFTSSCSVQVSSSFTRAGALARAMCPGTKALPWARCRSNPSVQLPGPAPPATARSARSTSARSPTCTRVIASSSTSASSTPRPEGRSSVGVPRSGAEPHRMVARSSAARGTGMSRARFSGVAGPR